jgi:hypothetical protein
MDYSHFFSPSVKICYDLATCTRRLFGGSRSGMAFPDEFFTELPQFHSVQISALIEHLS